MTPRELRIVSALAVFLCAALPAAAGAVAFRAQPVLVALIAGEATQLNALTSFFFNHFTAALLLLLVTALGATGYAAAARKGLEADPATGFAKLVVAACFSAVFAVLFLGLFVLATALPVYAKITQR